MNAVIVYCSKTGNTEKVAHAVLQGLNGAADMVKLDLTPHGILKRHSKAFTFDMAPYDLIFFGGWTMVMRVHPQLAAYIQTCRNLEGKRVAGFITGGTAFSREHVRSDFEKLIGEHGAQLVGFTYISTLLGPLLTRKKLGSARDFAIRTAQQQKDEKKSSG